MTGDLVIYDSSKPKPTKTLQIRAFQLMIKELEDKIDKLTFEKDKILTTSIMRIDLEIESNKEHITHIRNLIRDLENTINV